MYMITVHNLEDFVNAEEGIRRLAFADQAFAVSAQKDAVVNTPADRQYRLTYPS